MSYLAGAKKLKAEIDANQATVDMVDAAGGIRKTEPEPSDKMGFDWVKTYVGDTLVMTEYIPQEQPQGTADNPFDWTEDTILVQGAFYRYDGVRKVWTGPSGVTASWDDGGWEEF